MADIYQFKASAIKGSAAIAIDFESDELHKQVSMLIDTNYAMSEMFELARNKYNSEIQDHIAEKRKLMRENEKLRKKVSRMEGMLRKSVPMHTIYFLIINAVVITLSATLIISSYIAHMRFIDLYYLFCALIISITLFCTALRTLIDWRKMLNEKGA